MGSVGCRYGVQRVLLHLPIEMSEDENLSHQEFETLRLNDSSRVGSQGLRGKLKICGGALRYVRLS